MATFTVTNSGTVSGGPGDDTLVLTYDTSTNDVWLINLTVNPDGGYDGFFNGLGTNDTVFTGIENFSFIDRSGGNDIIRTGDGNDFLSGGAGNDELHGGAGNDHIDGGPGIDLYGVDLSARTEDFSINLNTPVKVGGGSVRNVEGFKNLSTGSGNDWIANHKTAAIGDSLSTGAGNDTIKLYSGGTDYVDGGIGYDWLTVIWNTATNGVWLTGMTANPDGGYDGQFNGLGSNNTNFTGIERFTFIDRSGGDDIIRTGAGDDKLIGGAGNDVLDGGSGSDWMDGGSGMDTYMADQSALSSRVFINLNFGVTVNGGAVSGFEAFGGVTTGSGNDLIVNHRTAGMGDTLSTGAGHDRIILYSGGTDKIDGGAWYDVLKLIWNSATNGVWLTDLTRSTDGRGYDGMFNGIDNNDTIFSNIENFVFVDKSGGDDIINTGRFNDRLSGGGGDDALNGGGGRDKLYGNSGVDTLNGGSGKDKLYGGSGDDFLFGDNGGDTLWGGAGDDTLTGGKGHDYLYGGKGSDVFIINSKGGSTIMDLSASDGDRIFIDDALWGEVSMTNAEIIEAFAVVSLGHTDITFGDSGFLRIWNYSNFAELETLITVF